MRAQKPSPSDMHKSSILQLVTSNIPQDGPKTTRLLHSLYQENKKACSETTLLIKDWIKDRSNDFTGLMVQYENIALHFVEASDEKIEEYLLFIRELKIGLKQSTIIKILVLNEHYTDRVFIYYGNGLANTNENIYPNSNISEKKAEEYIWSIYERFLTAGKVVRNKLKEEKRFTGSVLKQALDNVSLTSDMIGALFSQYSLDIDEYYDVYHSSEFIKADGEEVWPVKGYVSEIIQYSKEGYDKINEMNLV